MSGCGNGRGWKGRSRGQGKNTRGKIMIRRLLSIVLAIAFVSAAGLTAATAAETRPLVLHVKTSLSVDDAQICVVPNIAWAALSEGRAVPVVFDGSAVT